MVQYILRTQSECAWVWGPVSQWYLDLRGIDSVGDTGNDVMEIVARLDASTETQEMLLDSFVDGIFHNLFKQKFTTFGRPVFICMRVLDGLYLVTLYATAMLVKNAPEAILYADDSVQSVGPTLLLVARWLPCARSPPPSHARLLMLVPGQPSVCGRLRLLLAAFGCARVLLPEPEQPAKRLRPQIPRPPLHAARWAPAASAAPSCRRQRLSCRRCRRRRLNPACSAAHPGTRACCSSCQCSRRTGAARSDGG